MDEKIDRPFKTSVSLSQEERVKLRALARKAGLSPSDYIRSLIRAHYNVEFLGRSRHSL